MPPGTNFVCFSCDSCDFPCDLSWNTTAHKENPCQICTYIAKKKAWYSANITKYKARFGGKRGIRTLDTLLTYTRVPVVRLRPAQPSFLILNWKYLSTKLRYLNWCEWRDLNPYANDTRPSNVPVCLFQHTRIEYFNIISNPKGNVNNFFEKN